MTAYTLYPLYALTTSDPRDGGALIDTMHYEGDPDGLEDLAYAMNVAKDNGLEVSVRKIG